MTDFIYDLLYALPICLFVMLSGASYINMQDRKGPVLIFSILFLISVSAFYNMKNRLRYIIPGMLVVSILAVVLVQGDKSRAEFISDNVWVLWLLLAAIVFFTFGKITSHFTIARIIAFVMLIALLSVALFKNIETEVLTCWH